MNVTRSFVYGFIAIMVLYLGALYFIITNIFPDISSTVAGLLGVAIGSIGTFASSTISTLSNFNKSKYEIKDRIAHQALELSRMYFDLQQKSSEDTQKVKQLLSPIKVYRELYRALIEFEKSGSFPKKIEELGLLNVFQIGHK
jgi:hypothetical protein